MQFMQDRVNPRNTQKPKTLDLDHGRTAFQHAHSRSDAVNDSTCLVIPRRISWANLRVLMET